VNPFRAQLPVYSPLTLGALGAGLLAALGAGQAGRRVEQALRAHYAPHGLLLTDSGTSALALALRLAVAERPGPVALPAYCCYDVATAVDAAGVPFLLYDLDPATLGPDEASLRAALAAGAGTVVVAHLYGVPVDLPSVEALVRSAGAVLIEDAAQGVGASVGGRPTGTLGRYGILSFGRGKGITGGRGGALLANAPDAAIPVAEGANTLERAPRNFPPDLIALLGQWALARPALYGIPLALPWLRLGETIYRPPTPPKAAPAFALGVLGQTWALAAAESETRRRHARRLLECVTPRAALCRVAVPLRTEAGYLRLPMVVAGSAMPAVRQAEARALGIWPGYPASLADLGGFGERCRNRNGAFPGARGLAASLVTLPTHSRLRPRDLAALESWIAKLG
jgi:perosamine synthetase